MASTLCKICSQNATDVCSGCRKVVYCSEACQKTDWNINKHFEVCGKRATRTIIPLDPKKRTMWTVIRTDPGLHALHEMIIDDKGNPLSKYKDIDSPTKRFVVFIPPRTGPTGMQWGPDAYISNQVPTLHFHQNDSIKMRDGTNVTITQTLGKLVKQVLRARKSYNIVGQSEAINGIFLLIDEDFPI